MYNKNKYFSCVLICLFLIGIGFSSVSAAYTDITLPLIDSDGDRILDPDDNCPFRPNISGQFNNLPNCMDADSDGFEDTLYDKCLGQKGTLLGCPEPLIPTMPICTNEPKVKENDFLMIQIKGTPHVSDPVQVVLPEK